ncbi:MAG: endonuclease/exonuclease/phosphatase family protein [Clostridia bacterium]|nr:endonuclease/exonuclease/phosphatase family protein [Clostridia bacterium]
MKKLSLFLLLALLVALMFTVSCGSTNTPSETTAPSSSSADSSGVSTTTTTTAPITTTATTTATVTTQAPNTTSKPTVKAEPVKLLTFNLRYDITSHELMSLEVRGPHLMEIIKKYDPDSISFCEATNNWMKYLREEMPKLGYSCVGVGRDSGATGGTGNGNEHSPVFYKTDKYELLESDTFWISDTPEVAGKAWGTSIKRICSYAVLKDKNTGASYAHFGTHLDHQSEEARQNAALVIESYIREVLKKYGDIGIVLSGDFNTSMSSTAYLSFTSFLDDSRSIAKEKKVVGITTNSYRPNEWESSSSSGKTPTVGTGSPIDYIFLGKNTASVSVYTVVNDLFTFEHNGKTWHEHPISDHYGVFCEATFTSPTANLPYSENKLITYRAEYAPSATLPSSYEGLSIINDRFSVSCNLLAVKPISNVLTDDSSVGSVMVSGNKNGVWEITLSTDTTTEIQGLSFTTGTAATKLPQMLRVYVSNDGSSWKRMGSVYTDEIEASTTYYLSNLSTRVRTKYVKLVFSDCDRSVELANINIYGQ